MAKPKESPKSKVEKVNAQAKERMRRYRAKLSEEKLEEKRKYDRDRYAKLKKEKKIKPIAEMTDREQRKVRKKWKLQNKRKKDRRAQLKLAKENTPPPSPQPGTSQDMSEQKKRGRKAVRKDRAKAYRTIDKQNRYIDELERKLRKYKKRLDREKNKTLGSPSPRKLVKNVVGPKKVSPAIKKQLFLGFALKKQLESKAKQVSGTKKQTQQLRKTVGIDVLQKYRVQGHFKKIVPYKVNKLLKKNSDPSVYTKKDRLGVRQKEKNSLQSFFEDDSVSKMCPGKKDVVKVGRFKKQRRILLDTLSNLHKRYLEENASTISVASFVRSKPKWVQAPKKSDRETCACVKHANMELLVEALRKHKIIEEKNITELMASVVCSVKSETCMMGKCDVCKDKQVTFSYTDDFKIKYFKWVNIKEERTIKNKKKIIQKTIKLKTVKPIAMVIELYKKELVEFKKHLFYAIYQQTQLKTKLTELDDNELMFRIDFAENYVAKFNTEVQSLHFGASKRQVSMHTGVRYAKENGVKKTFSFCTVSDHLDHQSHAIWAHLKPILLKSAAKFPLTTKVHFYSDSPSSQYRNRNNIYLFKETLPQIFPNITTLSWNFTEAGHGKGPMDGVGGTLKREADRMVAHGADIKNASDFCAAHAKTKIFMQEIKPHIIDEMKMTVAETVVPPIQGILKARQITYFEGGRMYANKLSCFRCDFSKTCTQHHLFEVFPKSSSKPSTKKKILTVEDVYGSSSEDEHIPLDDNYVTLARPLYSNTMAEEPETSKNTKSSSTEINEDKIQQGVFVIVKFDTSKKSHIFLGVCQTPVVNGEFQVLFMKNSEKDKCSFVPNETDISFVQLEQVVAFPPQPTLITRGNRVFYHFARDPIIE